MATTRSQLRMELNTHPARIANPVIPDRPVAIDVDTCRVSLVEDVAADEVQLEMLVGGEHADAGVGEAVGTLNSVAGEVVVEILLAAVNVGCPEVGLVATENP